MRNQKHITGQQLTVAQMVKSGQRKLRGALEVIEDTDGLIDEANMLEVRDTLHAMIGTLKEAAEQLEQIAEGKMEARRRHGTRIYKQNHGAR